MRSFEMKTKIYFGENALDRLLTLPYKKVMLIADPYMVQSGMIQSVTSRLDQAGICYELFSNVCPDPPIEKIADGIKAVTSYVPEALLALGGGSAIDSAKAIRDFSQRSGAVGKMDLIAIPTTSGTGSEVTSFSVLSDPDHHAKYPLVSDSLLPSEAILDTELVRSVPPGITADTGMDVLTHALEAYVSTDCNEFAEAFAEKAIEICGQFLLRSFRDSNDLLARQKMHTASCLAGLAFNSASLGLNHGMAHQLGAGFHIPHGRANAILLPFIIRFNSNSGNNETEKRYSNAARILRLNSSQAAPATSALISWIKLMLREMDMPESVSQCVKCTEAEYKASISGMAEAALQDNCTITNPRKANRLEVEALYRSLWF